MALTAEEIIALDEAGLLIEGSPSTIGWGEFGNPFTTIIVEPPWRCAHCGKLRDGELLECPGCGYVRAK